MEPQSDRSEEGRSQGARIPGRQRRVRGSRAGLGARPARAALPLTLVLALGLALGLGLVASCKQDERPPDLLLITVDTLRFDRVWPGADGHSRMPNLWAFAQQGQRFLGAQSPRAKTTPALASLMTGWLPADHLVRDLDTPLDGDFETLAEALKRGDYETAAIVGNFVCLDRRSGLAQGFDVYVEDLPSVAGIPERRADSLIDGALCALGLGLASKDGAEPRELLFSNRAPRFLWLHLMDPHGPYDPPAEFRPPADLPVERLPPPGELSDEGLYKPWIAQYNVPEEARLLDSGIDVARVRALYDGEVAFVDQQLGRLFDALDANGLLDRTLVAVTADHGESLGEHAYWFEHGRYGYQTSLHVPLIVRWPGGGLPAGELDLAVPLIDLAPTLLELVGVAPLRREPRGDLPSGRSQAAAWLRPLGSRAALEPQPLIGEKVEGYEQKGAVLLTSLELGQHKLIRRSTFTSAFDPKSTQRERRVLSEECYDLSLDPGETVELIAAKGIEPEILAELRRELNRLDQGLLDPVRAARWLERRDQARARQDPGDLEAMRRLGYVR